MEFDKTQSVLLNLLSNALFQKPLNIPEDVAWETVYQESMYQAVSSLAFSAIPKGTLSAELNNKWELNFNMDLLRNSKISYAHSIVDKLLSAAKIPYVILKGCVSASYYETPMLRKLGDVDFLVKPEDFEKAERVFIDNGFESIQTNHEYEIELKKDNVVYELHRKINGVPDNKVGLEIEKLFDDIYEKAEFVETEFAQYRSVSQFHHGITMLLHVARHMITGGIGLRHLCDWAVFVDKIGEDFVFVFKDKLESVGLWKFAQVLTDLCTKYLGCPKMIWAGNMDDELLDALKDDVFAGGNFGRKDMSRADEAKFITSRKDGGVSDKNMLAQAVSSANEIVRKHWGFADKFPLVYPFGWIYYGGKYAVKALFGKREKKDIAVLINGADKRKELYEQLRLFE